MLRLLHLYPAQHPLGDIIGTTPAALSVAGATTSTLCSVDRKRGVASLPTGGSNNTIGGAERLRGLCNTFGPALRALEQLQRELQEDCLLDEVRVGVEAFDRLLMPFP